VTKSDSIKILYTLNREQKEINGKAGNAKVGLQRLTGNYLRNEVEK